MIMVVMVKVCVWVVGREVEEEKNVVGGGEGNRVGGGRG